MLTPSSGTALEAAASALGVDTSALGAGILTRQVMSGRGSLIIKPHTVAEAISCRDALAHEVYLSLFKWCVGVVNRSLAPSDGASASTESADSRFIAILDIFGFENLETNSLEQLLINHTNEKLQLYFLQQTMQAARAQVP